MPQLETKTASARPAGLKTAALQIARFRALLDWSLALPIWEAAIAIALHELQIVAGRQGVSQATALRSLPIEQKQRIVRNILATELARPSFAESKRLARLAGIDLQNDSKSFDKLSSKNWVALRQRLTLRLASRYDQYKTAQNELFAYYYSLPLACSAKWVSQPRLREDACQEGRLALLEAIDRIDPEQGFEAYARQWIERRLRNFVMREQIPVKAPINLISKSLRSEKDSCQALNKAIREGSVQLDDPSQPKEADAFLRSEETDAPNRLAIQSDESEVIEKALSELTDKQRLVVEYRFGLSEEPSPLTLAQIAQRTGISRQQVFQREQRALQKLQQILAPLNRERAFDNVALASA